MYKFKQFEYTHMYSGSQNYSSHMSKNKKFGQIETFHSSLAAVRIAFKIQ